MQLSSSNIMYLAVSLVRLEFRKICSPSLEARAASIISCVSERGDNYPPCLNTR